MNHLQCYLVGGAVRDALLGRPVGDRDWVVVGSSVEEMLSLGFVQVGRDFPVFLHPETHEEYALARTERKVGQGHTGFVVHAAPDVTLEEDLLRRDLTINAIAQDSLGHIIDPFGGVADLEDGRLRHVSDAFVEDPLRVFRCARLAAQLDFDVASQTLTLMTRICIGGEIATLSAERVWVEFCKALDAKHPEAFFTVLARCHGLDEWFPEMVERECTLTPRPALYNFALLGLDADELAAMRKRLKIPNSYFQAASDCLRYGTLLSSWTAVGGVSAEDLVDALVALKVTHSLDRLEIVLLALDVPEAVDLRQLARRIGGVSLQSDVEPGPAYGRALRQARVAACVQFMHHRTARDRS